MTAHDIIVAIIAFAIGGASVALAWALLMPDDPGSGIN